MHKKNFFFAFCFFLFSQPLYSQLSQDQKQKEIIKKTLTSLNQNLQDVASNLSNQDYLQGKKNNLSVIKNLEILENLFRPLLDQLKNIKKDSQESKENIKKNNIPQNTKKIAENTDKALQESKQAKPSNEKVENYIQEAIDYQKQKKEALAQNDWGKAHDMENRNINAIQKAIEELQKQQGGNGGNDKGNNEKNPSDKSKEADDKINQIQAYQEQLKREREKIFGKRKNAIQKIPVGQDW